MAKLSVVVFSVLLVVAFSQTNIFTRHYQEALKIAESMTLDQKIGQMIQADFRAITNEERQVTTPEEAVTLALGSLLVNANAAPTENGNLARLPSLLEYEKQMEALRKSNTTNWKRLTDRFQNLGVSVATKDGSKYKIKFLLGTDAVHGDQHTVGSILFPHNIGLSCSKNQGHFENLGYWTLQAVKLSGFNYVFAPTVAVSHNPQWGRFYETLGQDQSLVEKYSQAFVRGLQQVTSEGISGVLGTAKHFIGDGATLYGCNEGNAQVLNFKSFLSRNSRGFGGAAKANVGSVMVSYSSINWIPNAINSHFLLNTLREELGFGGFTISDYDDLQNMYNSLMPRTFMNFTTEEDAFAAMVNAGVDMFMVSKKTTIERLFKHAKKYTEHSYIPESRLNDAVTRILSVKLAMGLVEKTKLDTANDFHSEDDHHSSKAETKNADIVPQSSSGNEYSDSLSAVHESLVLLKNNNVLPVYGLTSAIKYVVLLGEKIHNLNRLTKIQLFRNYDNIGMQCGGWSVRWQGVEGNQFWTGDLKSRSNASSVLDALKNLQKQNNFELIFANYSSLNNELLIEQERTKFVNDLKVKRKDLNSRNTLILGTFGEIPYAETDGDVNIPYCRVEANPGCLYNPTTNPYATATQSRSLKIELTKYDKEIITTVKQQDSKIPFVSVILSGRPLLIDELMTSSDAILAAWLPGTSGGQGIIDALVGSYKIRPASSKVNTLSMDWPKDMSSLENFPIYGSDGSVPTINDPLFAAGFGLSTSN